MKILPNISTFIGCDADYEKAKIIIYGAPFDSTTSFRPGTRFGPNAIRNESFGIETYSPYQDKDLTDISVLDIGDLELCFGNPAKALSQIEEMSAQIISDGKIPCMLGGEHLVTLGNLKGILKKYSDIYIIHFDAHADLRDDYLGQKLSHASVMRRCWELVGDGKIFQYGIRSGDKSEFIFAEGHVNTHKFDLEGISQIIAKLKGKNVYVTIDLDVLDPSEFPGTGTPEAGGISFKELLSAVTQMSELNIVGFDINELSPQYDLSGASTALACKLLREVLLSFYK